MSRLIDADAFIKRLKDEQEIAEVFFGSVEPRIVEVHKAVMEMMIKELENQPAITDCSECPLKRP